MRMNRIVFVILTLLTASPLAQAEICSLADGRQFATDMDGIVSTPIELVGFRLRERDDLAGFEIFRPWSSVREVLLVASCMPGYEEFGGGHFARGSVDKGRDSGGNCQSRNSDGTCSGGDND